MLPVLFQSLTLLDVCTLGAQLAAQYARRQARRMPQPSFPRERRLRRALPLRVWGQQAGLARRSGFVSLHDLSGMARASLDVLCVYRFAQLVWECFS